MAQACNASPLTSLVACVCSVCSLLFHQAHALPQASACTVHDAPTRVSHASGAFASTNAITEASARAAPASALLALEAKTAPRACVPMDARGKACACRASCVHATWGGMGAIAHSARAKLTAPTLANALTERASVAQGTWVRGASSPLAPHRPSGWRARAEERAMMPRALAMLDGKEWIARRLSAPQTATATVFVSVATASAKKGGAATPARGLAVTKLVHARTMASAALLRIWDSQACCTRVLFREAWAAAAISKVATPQRK